MIQRDSSELAAIEAVVCKRPATTQWTTDDLTSHFQKLLGYSTCKLFFHLTYSHLSHISSIVILLKKISVESAPPNFSYLGADDLPAVDSRPTGFIAQYRTQDGDISVVFLVLNLAQGGQREAAKLAGRNSARAPGRRGRPSAEKPSGRRKTPKKRES